MNILNYTPKLNNHTSLKVNAFLLNKAKSLFALKKFDEAIPFL